MKDESARICLLINCSKLAELSFSICPLKPKWGASLLPPSLLPSLHPIAAATVSQPADLRLQTRRLNIHRLDLHSLQMAKTDARYGKCQFSKICFRDKTNKAIQQDGAARSLLAGPLGGCARACVCADGCKVNFEAFVLDAQKLFSILWVASLPLVMRNKSALLSP